MITLRKAADRGTTQIDWLDSRHSFSFGDYYDPRHMGFGPLRVINEDFVQPGQGFGMHPHRDMEIITYIVSGALEHKDSLGSVSGSHAGGSVIRPGDVQRMTAGTGIRHSEFNPLPQESVHLLQIWILPQRAGLAPSYEQKTVAAADRTNRLRLIVSPDGRDGSVTIHQQADVYATLLEPGKKVTHELSAGRIAWLQLIRGDITLNGNSLKPGDGAAIEHETRLEIAAHSAAELLLFDMNSD
ncbi:MAG TPA: pirin family protein [Pirellulales bacterium]|nr:pirin family protein [Pirellulales bacterium]